MKLALCIPGLRSLLILQDLIRNLTITSCKSLQETYKIASKTAYKILEHEKFHNKFKTMYLRDNQDLMNLIFQTQDTVARKGL